MQNNTGNIGFYVFDEFYHRTNGTFSFFTNGNAVQHLQYLPLRKVRQAHCKQTQGIAFGESFINQRATSHDIRFKFTGKERDSETGFDYFGARYYDSDLSIWLSVDPMAFKYPHESPYSYVGNRPINTIDTWGMDKIEDPNGNTGEAGDYKQTADKKYLYGEGMKTLVWNPNKAITSESSGSSNIANPTVAGGYDAYEGASIDFDSYGKPATPPTAPVTPTIPTQINATPWMNSAMNEYNKKVYEIPGSRANPNIIKYLHSAGNRSNSDETPWCAAFVHYNLGQAGIKGAGAVGNNYLSWGTKIDKPVYGAIAIFKLGHVGFYAGSVGGNYIILHGNWSNAVSLSKYIKPSEIKAFVVPPSYIIR